MANRFAALIDTNNNNNNNNNNRFSGSKNNRNERHNKFRKDDSKNRFHMREKREKIEKIEKREKNIDIGEIAFPSLVKRGEYTQEEKQANPTKGMSYIEKIKYFKELNEKKDPLPKGWTILSKNQQFAPYEKVNIDENPYYNPYNAFAIIYERYINREELNNIIGDISPHWNMDEQYEYDTRDLEENDNDNESDYSDNFDEEEICDNF